MNARDLSKSGGTIDLRAVAFDCVKKSSEQQLKLPRVILPRFERRLRRRNRSWGEVSEGGQSPPPSN
jgi:hypothetical protein